MPEQALHAQNRPVPEFWTHKRYEECVVDKRADRSSGFGCFTTGSGECLMMLRLPRRLQLASDAALYHWWPYFGFFCNESVSVDAVFAFATQVLEQKSMRLWLSGVKKNPHKVLALETDEIHDVVEVVEA